MSLILGVIFSRKNKWKRFWRLEGRCYRNKNLQRVGPPLGQVAGGNKSRGRRLQRDWVEARSLLLSTGEQAAPLCAVGAAARPLETGSAPAQLGV